ncbi:hypothetical protein R1sor_000276 [Riccia sorocarpa]|uniref:Uncharacterized protein n=1 Tax=Riccia sorocarpa TaxID=122646 RepID=A0ABD3GWM6_9MARC
MADNGLAMKFVAWSLLFACLKNWMFLNGYTSNSSYLPKNVTASLFRAILFGEPVNFAPVVLKRLIQLINKFNSPKPTVNSRHGNRKAFEMFPVLVTVANFTSPGSVMAERHPMVRVPPSMILAVYAVGAEVLDEYDVIGKHVRGDFLSRFTKLSDFEHNRLELMSQQCTVGEPVEWPEPDQSCQGHSGSQSHNTTPTVGEAEEPAQEDASSPEVGPSVPKKVSATGVGHSRTRATAVTDMGREEADDATMGEPSTMAEPSTAAPVLLLENTPTTSSQPPEGADKHDERLVRDRLFISQIHNLIYGTVKRRIPETAILGLPPLSDPLTEAVTELVRMGDVVRLSRQSLDVSAWWRWRWRAAER